MPESFHPINCHHRNIVLIFSEQLVIRFDIDLFKGELIATAGSLDREFGFVTEVAAGS
jgi:hypothetical protein